MEVISKLFGHNYKKLSDDISSYVYFINDRCGHIKIGVTTGIIQQRLDSLQTANALPLQLVGYFKLHDLDTAKELERKLHIRFSRYRLFGEWFSIKPVLRWIELVPDDMIVLVTILNGRLV